MSSKSYIYKRSNTALGLECGEDFPPWPSTNNNFLLTDYDIVMGVGIGIDIIPVGISDKIILTRGYGIKDLSFKLRHLFSSGFNPGQICFSQIDILLVKFGIGREIKIDLGRIRCIPAQVSNPG